jgi:hypothetical protein
MFTRKRSNLISVAIQQHPFFFSAPGRGFFMPPALVGVRKSTVPARFLLDGVGAPDSSLMSISSAIV